MREREHNEIDMQLLPGNTRGGGEGATDDDDDDG